jgi:PKD repeat protein
VACVGENILFTNSSQTNGGSPIQGFVWDFGDGNSSTDESVSHSYALPGTYTVILVATNASGAADPEIKDSYITILPTPSAEFDPIGLGCTIPLTLSFQFNGNEQSNYSYNWDFGNGNTQNIATPDDQTYGDVGEYEISLIVSDNDNGCADTVVENISVSNYQADFIFPETVCVGESVNFQDNSTAGVNQWEWNFGGLGSSNEENPDFTFAGAGTYNIQLVTNNTSSGCSGSVGGEIVVEAAPVPSFIADNTSDCAPATINFINTSPPGETFNWVFGNYMI